MENTKKLNRQKTVLGSLFTIALISGLLIACSKLTKPTHYKGISTITYTENASVIEKKHTESHYLNPIDNINPMRNIDPLFDYRKAGRTAKIPEKNEVIVRYSKGTAAIDDKFLFDSTQEGSLVNIRFAESYDVLKDRKGRQLSVTTNGYEIIDFSPVNK